jgi:tRNA-specific 2-thiouridylase
MMGGRTVATHAGVHQFTVGQRKGLGVAVGAPAFVTSIDGDIIHLGKEEDLFAEGAILGDVVFHPSATLPLRGVVRVRYRHEGAPATLAREGDDVVVRFAEPVRAVSPGQVAVVYDDDRVVAGGTILRALPRRTTS